MRDAAGEISVNGVGGVAERRREDRMRASTIDGRSTTRSLMTGINCGMP